MREFTKMSNDELTRRRKASVDGMKAKERKQFDEWYQEHCDRLYWTNGPCCAGCDHWESDMAETGRCTAGPILSGADVNRSLGIISSTYTPEPGHPFTKATHRCGMFADEFDWSTLSEEYLRRINYKPHPDSR